MFTGRKLALSLAFTALVALATGVSCKGFFVQPTLPQLRSIRLRPLDVGTKAYPYGTYDYGLATLHL